MNKERPKPRTLTDAQRDAIDRHDQSLCVSACAGSGKTRVLVERYARLVLKEGVQPDRILAITFSDQATHNMRRRLLERFRQEDCPIRIRQLEGACIATIHSFGKTILKEYPLEAGISPDARVMDEGEAHMLKEKTMRDVLATINEEELDLLANYGYHVTSEAVEKVHGMLRTFGIDPVHYSTAPVDLSSARDICAALIDITRELLRHAPSDKRVFKKDKIARLDELLQHLMHEQGDVFKDDDLVFYLLAQKEITTTSPAHAELFATFGRYIDRYIGLYVSGKNGPVKTCFCRLITRFAAVYRDVKQERKVLDFDDLLCTVAELLCDEGPVATAVRARLRGQYDHILVDEYQDTNTLQARIIDALAHEDNLFLVGDVRQSIYGFRGADVTVMQGKQKAFKKEKPKDVIALGMTHRTVPSIVAFINGLFTSIEELNGTDDFKAMTSSVTEQTDRTTVEILTTPYSKEQDENVDVARIKEGTFLARRIREMIDNKFMIRDEQDELRSVKYSDIGILFRSMTNVEIFERCLRAEDVKYYVMKRGEFYNAEEIIDIVTMLTVLERPYDDIAFAAIIRSPLCGLTNDGLYWIGQHGRDKKDMPFCNKVRAYRSIKELSNTDAVRIERFLQFYDTMRARKDHVALEILTRDVLELSEYEFKVMLLPEGERKYANIEKFKEVVKEYDISENGTLADFLNYLTAVKRLEVKEQEASLEAETSDTVKIMSVHKAKGLEFPVLCVADMGSVRNRYKEGKFTFTPQNGLGISAYIPQADDFLDDHCSILNKQYRARADQEEDMRVMYVALTRARDHLILSGSVRITKSDKKKTANLPSQWIDIVLQHCSVLPQQLSQNEKVPVNDHVQVMINPHELPETLRGRKPNDARPNLERLLSDTSEFTQEDKLLIAQVHDNIAVLQIEKVRQSTFSVTELVTYTACPRLYYYRFETTIPAMFLRQKEVRPATQEVPMVRHGYSDRTVGTVFHAIAAETNLRDIKEAELRNKAGRYATMLSMPQRDLLERCIDALVSKQFFKAIAIEEAQEYYTEVPITARIGHAVINGQIDALFLYDKKVLILDYKTSWEHGEGEISEEHWQQLQLYALLYSKTMSNAGNGQLLPTTIDVMVFFPQTNTFHKRSISYETLTYFEKDIATTIKGITSGHFTHEQRERCARCEFSDFCLK